MFLRAFNLFGLGLWSDQVLKLLKWAGVGHDILVLFSLLNLWIYIGLLLTCYGLFHKMDFLQSLFFFWVPASRIQKRDNVISLMHWFKYVIYNWLHLTFKHSQTWFCFFLLTLLVSLLGGKHLASWQRSLCAMWFWQCHKPKPEPSYRRCGSCRRGH